MFQDKLNQLRPYVTGIRFVKDFKVTSSRGLCEVYSCITNMATKYASYLTTAPQKAIEMGKYINQASAAYMAYNIGKKCGEAGYEIYLELIKTVADSCGCGCDTHLYNYITIIGRVKAYDTKSIRGQKLNQIL